MLKIKEWEDAEYLVQRIETGTMRMPDTGQQKRVMTNVIIHHKGKNKTKQNKNQGGDGLL
jgi:DNA ligase-1